MSLSSVLSSKPVLGILVAVLLRYSGVQLPLYETRVLYGVCMVLHIGMLLLLRWKIAHNPEGHKFTCRELDDDSKELVTKTYTCRSYDTKQAETQLRSLGMSALVTIGMHVWKAYTTPMVMASLQPVFMVMDPLFQLHVLGQKPDIQRPVQDSMTKWKIQMVEERDKRLAKEGKKDAKKKS